MRMHTNARKLTTPGTCDEQLRGELILTTQQLAQQLNVSTKTISRWRKLGLVSRWFVSEGRRRLGFLDSAVEQFVAANSRRVRFGFAFSQMTKQEREALLNHARQMCQAGFGPAEVTKRLARLTGRSAEAIRYTLKRHDQRNPSSAIFPDHYGPIREDIRHKIDQLHRRGESVETLSKRFCRTKTAIQRVIAQMRAQRIGELPLDYVPSPDFVSDLPRKRHREILAPLPDHDTPARPIGAPKGLPTYLASLYEIPLLTRQQEAHLFRRMNYLKYKAAQLRSRLDPQRPRKRLMSRIETLYHDSVATKNQLLRANLRLVVSIAKRHVGPTLDFFQLVSDGNTSLIRAVEKFDYSRGYKFSTYASWAIMKNYARSIPGEFRHLDRFRTGHGDVFAATADDRANPQEQEAVQAQRESQVGEMLKHLGQREQKIIVLRFGLDRSHPPRTLEEIGMAMGVSKERIRQLESRALRKLRLAADEERIAFSL